VAGITAPAGAGWRRQWLAPAALWAARQAHSAVVRARAWRLHAAVPAVTGAGLVSAAAALRFGLWAGLAVAGVFCLRFDARMS
jgi:hypothetical protein